MRNESIIGRLRPLEMVRQIVILIHLVNSLKAFAALLQELLNVRRDPTSFLFRSGTADQAIVAGGIGLEDSLFDQARQHRDGPTGFLAPTPFTRSPPRDFSDR